MSEDKVQYSPYCPICDACGEEGCCSAISCQQHPDGDYCESYLRALKFGYALNRWAENEFIETLPQEFQDKFNQKWDEMYDGFYNTKKK